MAVSSMLKGVLLLLLLTLVKAKPTHREDDRAEPQGRTLGLLGLGLGGVLGEALLGDAVAGMYMRPGGPGIPGGPGFYGGPGYYGGGPGFYGGRPGLLEGLFGLRPLASLLLGSGGPYRPPFGYRPPPYYQRPYPEYYGDFGFPFFRNAPGGDDASEYEAQ